MESRKKRKTLTDGTEVKVGVVVPSIHRWNFDIASMGFIHGLVIELMFKR